MIKLEGIRFQSIKPLFTSYTRKGLRISFQKIVRNSKTPGRALNQTLVEWDENIYLPIIFQREIPFEIYKPHSFGYNPEEFDSVFSGSILINNPDITYHAWEAFTKQNQLIGFFSARIHCLKSIRPQAKDPQQNYILSTEPKLVSIKSIVLYLPFPGSRTVYVEVDINGSIAKTGKRKSEKGSFVFLDSILLFKSGLIYEGDLNVYEFNMGQSILLGHGKMTLLSDKPQRKVMIMEKNRSIGEAYVEGALFNVDDSKKTGNFSQKSVQEIKTQKKGMKSQRWEKNERSSVPVRELISTGKNKSEHTSLRSKKVSVLYKNSAIVFNKEKRFSDNKTQSSNVSYLPYNSFDFKSPTCRMKRGTGMGFGWRTDFTKETKKIPGVGSYYLPSPFDRYE